MSTSQVLGHGTYGIITSKYSSRTCRKIFTKDKALSLVREIYMIKRLSYIHGITEMISLDLPTEEDRSICQNSWGVISMVRYNVTLNQWLRTNPTYTERMRVLMDLIKILAHVHAAGIVHADIKLENVMLAENGEVRLIDWGLAGPCGYARIHLTTKTYRPKQTIQDFCHDIYSLGVLAVELLLGSMLINNIDYSACIRLIKAANLQLPLKKLLSRMIDPDCLKRPDIFKICHLFSIPKPDEPLSDNTKLLDIPPEYGVASMEYPELFHRFISNHSETAYMSYAVIGAVYTCKDPMALTQMINYDHLLIFIREL